MNVDQVRLNGWSDEVEELGKNPPDHALKHEQFAGLATGTD